MPPPPQPYRGRLAPSPTGLLHLGHARTFWIAQQRAREHGGTLLLRNEDLDRARCRTEFATSMAHDLQWFGLEWQEGPDQGGPYGPYIQSERMAVYRAALEYLRGHGWIYPCRCSRRDIRLALTAPHASDEDPVYPGTCRPSPRKPSPAASVGLELPVTPGSSDPCVTPVREPDRSALPNRPTVSDRPGASAALIQETSAINWRFQVPDGETIRFVDAYFGAQRWVAGRDFGDFVVWRHDDLPAYQLAVVVDDHAMRISEVVRGADLLLSTARQVLLYRVFGWDPPAFFHCPLLTDEHGKRLAKRHDALSLRHLRQQGRDPVALRACWPAIYP